VLNLQYVTLLNVYRRNKKTNKSSVTFYTHYRLVHSYEVGAKIRHQNIVGLGTLEGVDKQNFKMLADRIEELITGNSSLLFPVSEQFDAVEKTAQIYAVKIMKEKLFSAKKQVINLTKEVETNYQSLDIEMVEHI